MTKSFACLALALIFASPLAAQGVVHPTVSENQVSLAVQLPGGLGADLTISFERVVGLSLANLGISAEVITPTSPALLSRLPSSRVSIPAAFPVLLRIEPPAAGGLSFSGIVAIELHTHNLNFVSPCPLRLFAATGGGRFEDITESMGMGSYRVRGTKGGFSEFLILTDLRPLNGVINQKFNRLEAILSDNAAAVPGPILQDLTSRLQTARAHNTTGQTLAAIQDVEGFLAVVQQHSGAEIPDVWRSAGDLVNVAGLLRAGGGTLRFSLNLKASGGL
jgi:hypothetical protein